MKTVAAFVGKHMKLIKETYHPVFIWLDREARKELALELKAMLAAELKSMGFYRFRYRYA